MPPQIKQDINRAGWETTDMPSVCEQCLPDNPYVQMTKEDYGAECRICTRPFTIFRWKADRTSRQKRTLICLTCARLKNCCQCCMLDLSFGLPITIRDAALKMIAPGPSSSINREYYAQNNEKEIEEGRGGLEAYDETDEKATELLRKLARSEPYSRRKLIEGGDAEGKDMTAVPPPSSLTGGTGGPVRSAGVRDRAATRGARGGGGGRGGSNRGGRPAAALARSAPSEQDWLPPDDRNIKSLFLVGVEEDLPEYKIREFFAKYGKLQSVVCSHRSHCAFINYVDRRDAEKGADACRGKAIIAGCPLRVTWGKPKVLDTMDRDSRIANAREGRSTVGPQRRQEGQAMLEGPKQKAITTGDDLDDMLMAPPPGEDDEANYASLKGN